MDLLKSRFILEPEADLSTQFSALAEELFCNWVLEKGIRRYAVIEAEFYARTLNDTHADPFVHNLPVQQKFGHWFLHSSGIDLTLGRDNLYFSVFIRGIRSLDDNTCYAGPWRVFQQLFEDAGPAYSPDSLVKLVPINESSNCRILSVPRVYLSLVEDSRDFYSRLRFLFKPYRFIRADAEEFSEKYLACLYLDRVCSEPLHMQVEKKIYDKYLLHFDKGQAALDAAEAWKVSSRLHRMAWLMGHTNAREF